MKINANFDSMDDSDPLIHHKGDFHRTVSIIEQMKSRDPQQVTVFDAETNSGSY